MARHKYKFNTSSLSYEKVETNVKQVLLKALSYLGTSALLAGLLLFLFFQFFSSPKEIIQKREMEKLSFQYQLLNDKFSKLTMVLSDLQDRDDNIYRTIFEADPIPASVRNAGFGGVNRYKDLEGYDNSELMIETSKRVDVLAKQVYIQSKSFDEVEKLAKNKAEMLASIPAIQPVSNKELKHIASGFGYRTHPIYKIQHFHTGLDFTANIGTEIYATGDGTVIAVENENTGYGRHVIVQHGYGYQTLYGHMSRFNARVGQKVKRGDVIGFVGNTGTSTGPHLHYEVIKNNQKINPVNFFYNDLSPAEYETMIQLSSTANQSFD